MAEIKIVKLVTGEELIGDFKKTEVDITLTNVGMIMLIPDQARNRAQLAIVPYMQYSSQKTFHFNEVHVILVVEPVLEVLNQYNQIFGSGLVLAKHI